MNTFDDFTFKGANTTRYVPVYGDAKGIIGAYRKYAEPHKKHEAPPLEIGQVPLFLLDGELTPQLLRRATEQLRLKEYVALYRPFDLGIKKRLNELYTGLIKCGRIKKDGTIAEWLQEDIHKYRASDNEDARAYATEVLKEILDYEKTREEYAAAITASPIDAATGYEITGDLNDYLYERAKAMYPLGVESVIEANTKQSAIPKTQYFLDGIEDAPAPKGVRSGRDGRQITLFDSGAEIDDTIAEIRGFIRRSVEQSGAATLLEIIRHCAEIGLYKGNITLYAIGAAFRDFDRRSAIFFDGVCYWRYTEVQDISSWILRAYDNIARSRDRYENRAAMFYDETGLKERMEYVFGLEPIEDKRLDTLGMANVHISKWIAENLRYPIAFLDGTLHKMLSGSSKGVDTALYGETLREYDTYFTTERCEWLKARIPHADTIARQAIKEAVGFDPDTTSHGMSGLPKGHYAPVLFSAENYIEEMLRKPKVAV